MLQPDSVQIQSRARVEALFAEAEQERLAHLARTAEPGRAPQDLRAGLASRLHAVRARLASLLYAAALRLDPPLALLDAPLHAPNNPCLKA